MIFNSPPWEFPVANEVEAGLLTSLLASENLPVSLVRHTSSLFGTALEMGDAYGHLETDADHYQQLQELYADFKQGGEFIDEPESGEES